MHQLLRGENVIDVRTSVSEFITVRFVLFGRARHDRNVHVLLFELFVAGAKDCGKHFHRTFRRGNVRQNFRIFGFRKPYPCRTTAGEKRHFLLRAEFLHKFRRFLHDRYVRRGGSVVNRVEAHHLEGRNDFAHNVFARFYTEFFADAHPDCRRNLHRNVAVFVVKRGKHFVNVALNHDCARRACYGALPAVDARRVGQFSVESGGNDHF